MTESLITAPPVHRKGRTQRPPDAWGRHRQEVSGSGDAEGLARMDLGTVTEEWHWLRYTSCRGSAEAVPSGWVAAGAVAVLGPPSAVLGSRPDIVTVVSTLPPPGVGAGQTFQSGGSGWVSSRGTGRYFPSKWVRAALSSLALRHFQVGFRVLVICLAENWFRWGAVSLGLGLLLLDRS